MFSSKRCIVVFISAALSGSNSPSPSYGTTDGMYDVAESEQEDFIRCERNGVVVCEGTHAKCNESCEQANREHERAVQQAEADFNNRVQAMNAPSPSIQQHNEAAVNGYQNWLASAGGRSSGGRKVGLGGYSYVGPVKVYPSNYGNVRK